MAIPRQQVQPDDSWIRYQQQRPGPVHQQQMVPYPGKGGVSLQAVADNQGVEHQLPAQAKTGIDDWYAHVGGAAMQIQHQQHFWQFHFACFRFSL